MLDKEGPVERVIRLHEEGQIGDETFERLLTVALMRESGVSEAECDAFEWHLEAEQGK